MNKKPILLLFFMLLLSSVAFSESYDWVRSPTWLLQQNNTWAGTQVFLNPVFFYNATIVNHTSFNVTGDINSSGIVYATDFCYLNGTCVSEQISYLNNTLNELNESIIDVSNYGLSDILANNNNAGIYDIDMNGNDILNVDDLNMTGTFRQGVDGNMFIYDSDDELHHLNVDLTRFDELRANTFTTELDIETFCNSSGTYINISSDTRIAFVANYLGEAVSESFSESEYILQLYNGTNETPVLNRVYAIISGGEPTWIVSVTEPTVPHAMASRVLVAETGCNPYASALQEDGDNGFLKRVQRRFRNEGLLYVNGLDYNATSTELTIGEGQYINGIYDSNIADVLNSSIGFYLVRFDGTFQWYDSFDDITEYSDGNIIGNNKYFNVIFGVTPYDGKGNIYAVVQSKPNTEYTSVVDAYADNDNTLKVFPSQEFLKTFFLPVARMVLNEGNDANLLPNGMYAVDYRGGVAGGANSGGGLSEADPIWSLEKEDYLRNDENIDVSNYNITGSQITADGGTGSANIHIVADSDNVNENDVATLTLSQDGNLISGKLGFLSSNNLVLDHTGVSGAWGVGFARNGVIQLGTDGNGNAYATNNMSADYFIGDGSQLTNVSKFKRNDTTNTLTPQTTNDILDVTSAEVTYNITGSANITIVDDSLSYQSPIYSEGYTWTAYIYGIKDGIYSENFITSPSVADDASYNSITFDWNITSSESFDSYKIHLNGANTDDPEYPYYNNFYLLTNDKVGGFYYEEQTPGYGDYVIMGANFSDSTLVPTTGYTNEVSLKTDYLHTEGITWNNLKGNVGNIIGNTYVQGSLDADTLRISNLIPIYATSNSFNINVSIGSGINIGTGAGQYQPNLAINIGANAGSNATNAYSAVNIGANSGTNTIGGYQSVRVGYESGQDSQTSYAGSYLGFRSGKNADRSNGLIAIGYSTGENVNNSARSILIGNYAGHGLQSSLDTFILSSLTSPLSQSDIPIKSFLYGKTSVTGVVANQYLRVNGALQLLDNNRIKFGTGQDASIYYTGTNLNIDPKNVGSGVVYVNGEVTADAYNEYTFTTNTTDKEAYDLVQYATANFYVNGIKDYKVWGECYNPLTITDMDRPEYTIRYATVFNTETGLNETELIEEAYYPHTKIQDSVSITCKQAMIAKANQYLNSFINPIELENGDKMIDGDIASFEKIYTESEVPIPSFNYVEVYDIDDISIKEDHYAVEINNSGQDRLDLEKRIYYLEGAMAQLSAEICLYNNNYSWCNEEKENDALDYFPEWVQPLGSHDCYTKDFKVQYNSKIYSSTTECNVYAPTVSGWREIKQLESDTAPDWVQPTGAHDCYAKDSEVTFNSKEYINTIECNVYAPNVYGWVLK